jgi:ABC-type multidrug transport system fused ATPase/permease subunit
VQSRTNLYSRGLLSQMQVVPLRFGEEIVGSLRRDLFRALLVQKVTFFDSNRAGELAVGLYKP